MQQLHTLLRAGTSRSLLNAGLLVGLCLALTAPVAAQQQLPLAQLTSIFPFGGKVGATFEVTLNGPDLDDLKALHFSHAGISAKPKMVPHPIPGRGEIPSPNQFILTINGDVPRGIYEARAVGRYGISNPRMFLVDPRPAVNETEPNDSREKAQDTPLDTHVFGTIEAEKSDYFKFTAKQGQRILIECWAHRADSRVDATLVLYDALGNEIGRNNDTFRRDPLLDFTAPADGVYIVQIYDFLHRGNSPEFGYRLTCTTGPLIDFVFPPAGVPGTKSNFAIYGRNLPGGTKSDVKGLDGKVLDRLEAEIELPADPGQRYRLPMCSLVEPQDALLDAFAYKLASPQGESNFAPIFFATAPVVLEQEPNNAPDKAQKVSLPCEIVGQFNPRNDQDWITFDAKKGETYYIEVYSERLGLSCDPYLRVQRVTKNDKGEETAADVVELDDPRLLPQDQRMQANFDMSSGDMTYKLTVPDDGAYRVLIRDLCYQSRGSPNYLYRMAIRPAQHDFRLIAVAEPPFNPQNNNQANLWTPLLQKGGTQALKVYVDRQDDFEDEIHLSVEGLPQGVTCPGGTIGPKANIGLLVLTAAEDAAEWSGPIRILGKAKINGQEVAREARGGSLVWGSNDRQNQPIRSRMTENVTIAVSGKETAATKIEPAAVQVFETSVAGKLQIPVKVTRRGEFKGNLKLVNAAMPKDLRFNDLDIGGDKGEGSVTLDVKNTAAPGTYTLVMQATTQLQNYRRNPEAAEEADKLAKEMEQAATESANAAKQAADAKAAAEKAANDMAAQAKQASDALAAATKSAQDAEAQAKAAADAFAQAKQAADAKTDDAGLQTQKAEKEKANNDAAEKLRQATEARTKAEQAVVEMTAKAQAAATAKQTADTALNEANAKKQSLENQKNQYRQIAQQKAEAAKPKNVNATYYTMPVTVKIAPAPVTLQPTAPAAAPKPGEKAELAVNLNRLYGFADQVTLSLVVPDASVGVKAPDVNVPKDQTTGKLMLELAKEAKPGEHPLTVRAKLNFNGQQVQFDQPVVVKVDAPAN
jgi:hypothetical protein